jgi:ArsR family transcriptional regulator
MAAIPDPIRKQCEEKGGIEGIEGGLPDAKTIRRKAKVFQALGDPMRLKIILALGEQPLCACLLKEMLGISDSKLSYHLAVLKRAGLIAGKKHGQWIIYGLTGLGRELASRAADF